MVFKHDNRNRNMVCKSIKKNNGCSVGDFPSFEAY